MSTSLVSGSMKGPNSLQNCYLWKDFGPKSLENVVSQASEGDVTHDKRTNSSLWKAL